MLGDITTSVRACVVLLAHSLVLVTTPEARRIRRALDGESTEHGAVSNGTAPFPDILNGVRLCAHKFRIDDKHLIDVL